MSREPVIVETTQPKSQMTGIREIPLPLASGTWPVLKGNFPMSPEAWEQMIALLQAMKPGLVRSEIE